MTSPDYFMTIIASVTYLRNRKPVPGLGAPAFPGRPPTSDYSTFRVPDYRTKQLTRHPAHRVFRRTYYITVVPDYRLLFVEGLFIYCFTSSFNNSLSSCITAGMPPARPGLQYDIGRPGVFYTE